MAIRRRGGLSCCTQSFLWLAGFPICEQVFGVQGTKGRGSEIQVGGQGCNISIEQVDGHTWQIHICPVGCIQVEYLDRLAMSAEMVPRAGDNLHACSTSHIHHPPSSLWRDTCGRQEDCLEAAVPRTGLSNPPRAHRPGAMFWGGIHRRPYHGER